ncbi:MAG: hypothetical protein AB7R89_09370 [Dehalococcoidia bacterium]
MRSYDLGHDATAQQATTRGRPVRSPSRYNAVKGRGGTTIKTVLTVLMLVGVVMALLGVVRVPFAVRFWRRMQWVAWVYVAVVLLSAIRLWFLN